MLPELKLPYPDGSTDPEGKGLRTERALPSPHSRTHHLVLSHSAEVVVAEKDAKFILLGRGRQLTQSMVGQLGCSRLQELLCDQACDGHKMPGVGGLASIQSHNW